MPSQELPTVLDDDLLEAVFGIAGGPAVADPETDGAVGELPTDQEEFAAPPRDER
jgi:hypothetical protein